MGTGGRRPSFTAEQVIAAIKGSGAIKSAIAKRLGCERQTFDTYLERYPTVKSAFESEQESLLDTAESILANNINFASRKQEETQEPIDSSDAKWLLSRKGKARGWADKQEVEHSSDPDKPVIVKNLKGISTDAI